MNAGVDIFHCSTRRFWEPEFEGSELNFAGWVKQLTGKPTITVGSVGLDRDRISELNGTLERFNSLQYDMLNDTYLIQLVNAYDIHKP